MRDSYVVRIEGELAELQSYLENFALWVEFESGRGSVGLTREMFDDAVSNGEWEES